MSKHTFATLFFAAAVTTSSCGTSSSYQAPVASVSNAGVQVAVTGERCYINRTAEQFPTRPDDDVFNLDVKLQVKNESGKAVVVSPEAMVLEEQVGQEKAEMRPMQSHDVTVAPGETRVLALDYNQNGDLDCHHDLTLDTGSAIRLGGMPVHLDPIRINAVR